MTDTDDRKEMKMDERDFREVCERLAKLEKTLSNGLKEDIAEVKDAVKQLHSAIIELSGLMQSTKTAQNIQWWLISLLIASFFITRFVK
jgi:DNA-binding GntR family transcriptional regulator